MVEPLPRPSRGVTRRDIRGQRFGRLVVTAIAEAARKPKWVCVCDCGAQRSVRADALLSGVTKSCGCLSADTARETSVTHGMSTSAEYTAWVNMRRRCEDQKSRHYANYGGRGVKVHEGWRGSFEAFFACVGRRPSPRHQLDRWPDNNGDYCPGNVRWASREDNQKNRRCSRIWIIDGQQFSSPREAAVAFGVHPSTIGWWCKGKKQGGRIYPPRDGCRAVLRNA